MKIKKVKSIAATIAAVIAVSNISVINVAAEDNQLIAFPGAEGGGMYTQGARAGDSYSIYHVTNLDNSGTGSFVDAVSQGNRIIVFDVAGNITLTERLKISASNLTILGQTAPGEGVCIGGEGVYVTGSQIIMRYLRFRMGDNSTSQEDALGGKDTSNIILDHCSVSWSEDEDLSFYAVKDFTAQYCIISESLNESNHSKGAHGYGGIWGGQNSTFHHNLIASHNSRTPRIGTSATVSSYKGQDDRESLVDIRNNVIYNWGSNSAYGGENGVRVNLVNNYYKPGPATENERFYRHYAASSNGGLRTDGSTLYADGNVMEGNAELTADNWAGVDTQSDEITWTKCESISDGVEYNGELLANDQYIYDYPITTVSAEDAYNDVLANAGANIIRDEIDERVVNDVINGTAPTGSVSGYGLIDSQDDVGGWCDLYGTAKTDTDKDGIPDEWEDSHGLDKTNRNDSITLASSGYTYIEEYANDVAASSTSSIDRSSLREAIEDAAEINRDEFTDETLAELDEAVENGKTVLGDIDSAQADIDTAAQAIEEALSALDTDYANYLSVKIEEAESLDETVYTAASYNAVKEAVSKGKAVLNTAYNRSTYKEAYDNLVSAIAALEASARVKLVDAYYDMKQLSPIDIDNWQEYADLVDEGLTLSKDLTASEEDYENFLIKIEAAKAALKGNFTDTTVWETNFNKIKSSNAFGGQDMNKLMEYGTNIDYSVGFYVEDNKVIFPKDEYDNSTYFCKFISASNNYIGKCSAFVVKKSDEDPSEYTDDIYFEADESFIESYDICFAAENSEYIGTNIFEAFDNSELFTAVLTSDNTLEVTVGENVYNVNVNFEKEKWYNLALAVNRDNQSFTFSVGGELVLENVPLSKIYNQRIYGHIDVYNTSYDSGEYICIDNFTFNKREYTAEPVYYEVRPFTGDADSNGALTANDSAVILAKVLNSDFTMAVEKDNSDGIDYLYKVDADGDGVLTANDAAMILSRVLNSAYVLPGESVTITVESTTEATTETSTETTTETATETSTETTTETTTESTTEPLTMMDEPTTEPMLDWVGDETETANTFLTRVFEQAVIKDIFL